MPVKIMYCNILNQALGYARMDLHGRKIWKDCWCNSTEENLYFCSSMLKK